MIFDKKLFESKYVDLDKRVPIDTLFLIGNGFDIWQGLDTKYAAFERYYENHIDEVLSRLNLQKRVLTDENGIAVLDSDGKPVTYCDVELFYGNPRNPRKLPHEFWSSFESSLDKVDDQELIYFFGRDGVKDIQACANNAQKILREIFCDWIMSIEISGRNSIYDFGDNVLFVNFNYTSTLPKRFGINEVNELHIHGSSEDKSSIIFGHSTHPERPFEKLRGYKDKPRFQGLYYIEEFLFNADKHVEDNYMNLRVFCALHGVRIEDIKKIYVLGLGFGSADQGYIKNLIYATEGKRDDFEKDLSLYEKMYLDQMDSDYDMYLHLNMQYAISHRERIMKTAPISFPEYEAAEAIINSFMEDPYYHMSRDSQIKLQTAAVRRRFRSEQLERSDKIKKEYLRMMRKKLGREYISPVDAYLEADDAAIKNLCGAEWHISYFSSIDKSRIESVMSGYGCSNYTLHSSIDECIKEFEIKE